MPDSSEKPHLEIIDSSHQQQIAEFINQDFAETSSSSIDIESDFWQGLNNAGTELWLDTGDIEAVDNGLWNTAFSGLTTNNTLLNKEIQKGIYDSLVADARDVLKDLDTKTRIIEAAFILNARHGLRLVNKFGAKVSVELHTACAHDIEASLAYGRRFHAIDPDNFIIKIPLTAEGLIATRILRQEGVTINFTLEFGARQNYVAARFAQPSYVNVFLGRLNSYIQSNGLGDGKYIGEKATLASQRGLEEIRQNFGIDTRQIAASLRSPDQIASLAGVDVHTIPAKVAADAPGELSGKWSNNRKQDYPVQFASPGVEEDARVTALWEISNEIKSFADSIAHIAPQSGEELIERANEMKVGDLFPGLTEEEFARIAADGKIPRHDTWDDHIRKGAAAIDSLLNLAGLASFATDQKALDERIASILK
ncbi:MAG: transaldolase [Chitinivibrionales bacterium]|nr:transaldolase [Chitinivibrionales bacterium]